jgi:ribonuclease-3
MEIKSTIIPEVKIKVENLEKRINYVFKNKQLAADALTHSSFYNEHKRNSRSNERLEFLGDSVLSIITCEYLYSHLNEAEGMLTKIKAALVCEDSLYNFAAIHGIGECLLFGKGERTVGTVRKSTLADAVEAVLGAIYLDSGMDRAKEFILPYLIETLNESDILHDWKTTLQEIVQKNPEDVIEYVLASESGPDHNKHFVMEVRIDNNVVGRGGGKSKKEAEQQAAREALELMGY